VLIDEARGDLVYAVKDAGDRTDQLVRAASAMVQDPTTLEGFPAEVATKIANGGTTGLLGITLFALHPLSTEAVRAAMQAVKIMQGGIAVVDKGILSKIDPLYNLQAVLTKLPISPTSLVLAYGLKRPSTLMDPAEVQKRVGEVIQAAKAGDADGIKAAEAIEKANRALERRVWVEWYKRIEATSQDPTSQVAPTMPQGQTTAPSTMARRETSAATVVAQKITPAPAPASSVQIQTKATASSLSPRSVLSRMRTS